jgi:hypothetical protein
MPNVRCPVCLITYDVSPEESGGKIQCRVCGQKMRVAAPPAGENKTVLVRWEEPEVEPARRRVDEPPARSRRDEEEDDRPHKRKRRRRDEDDYDDDDDRRMRYCRHCDRRVRPDVTSRMAQPWSMVCFIVGAVMVFFLLGIALIVIGAFLKQRVEHCPDCGDELHVGDVGFGG